MQAASSLEEKVQAQLETLLQRELDEDRLFKQRSYANLRVSYLRAVSKLRPIFFEDDEDFLDQDKRLAEWAKRQRFNELKKLWIRYDKIAPDKAHDLSLEDQEIENDLDMIEEEIQEEWTEFTDELLDMLDDDEDDEEDYGDEDDMKDLDQWRVERKQMKQDASLLKRRILERTVQRRIKEEEAQKKLEKEIASLAHGHDQKKKRKVVRKKASQAEIKLLRQMKQSSSRSLKGPCDDETASPAKETKKVIRIRVKKASEIVAPKTPRVVRQSKSFESPFNVSFPNLDTSGEDLFKISPKRASRRGSLSNQKASPSRKRETNGISALKEKFSRPVTPTSPDRKTVLKTKSWTSVHSPGSPSAFVFDKKKVQRSLHSSPSKSPNHDQDSSEKSSRNLGAILKTLGMYAVVPPVELIKALTDLQQLACEDVQCRRDFSRGKGNALLADSLQHYHKNNSAVTEACCKACTPLVRYETNRDALALAGVIENIMVGMLQHRDCSSLQIHGCDALCSFAVASQYQDWIGQSNGIQVLIKTQASFSTDCEVQAACFRWMAQLAKNHRRNAQSIAAEGGVKALTATMNMAEYKNNPMIHRAILQAAATLAREYDANRGSIAKEDGIYLILLAMDSFSTDEKLQQYALEALCALAQDHAQNCRSISEQGGLPLILKVMKEHAMHDGVQGGALSLLRMMTEDDEVSPQVVEANGIDRVLAAMRNLENATVHEQGCLTLCNMAVQEENKDTIRNLGGIRMIVSTMRLLRKSTFVQKGACRALDSLATNDPSKVNIAASGGVSAMISAMQNHPDVAGLQALAITALRKVATVARNRNIMKTNNGIEVVELAMRKYPKHAHLQEHGKALVKLLDPTRSLFLPESSGNPGNSRMPNEHTGERSHDRESGTQYDEVAKEKQQTAGNMTRETKPRTKGVDPGGSKQGSVGDVAGKAKARVRGVDAPGYRARRVAVKKC